MNRKRDLVSELIVTVFRLNGRLVEAGNGLVKDLGLTSAWWQVLGALTLSPMPLPVAHIARNMGLTRQAVQRVVDLLADAGFVRFEPNRHHLRAKLVVLTDRGKKVFDQAMERQAPWALSLSADLASDSLVTAIAVLKQLDGRLASSSMEDDT